MQSIQANLLLRSLGVLEGNPAITQVVTDSRSAVPGSLFVCIRGERTDGHHYAAQARKRGAAGIVAEHAAEGVPAQNTVLVPNALDALITMGGNYRAQYHPVLAGVTGSVGKTTTKEFCYAVFSEFGETLKTEGNQNNEIGMPNTLFRLEDSVRYAVVEMGMQGRGEIEKLTLAARPAGAIITCVGVSHLEQLGTRENICAAKMEICDGMTEGAPLVLNGDDAYLPKAKVPDRLRRVLFAIENRQAEVVAQNIRSSAQGTSFRIEDKAYGCLDAFIPTMGVHNVRNALGAYTLATRLGLDAARAARALAQYETTGYRQNIVEHNGVTVIEDCYNASPDSMRAALSTLEEYPAQGKRIAVLGDMFELGSATESAHIEVGDLCARHSVDVLLTVGEAMRFAHRRAEGLGVPCTHCGSREDAVALLKNICGPGDAVLVKASHGMQFEKILEGFYESER